MPVTVGPQSLSWNYPLQNKRSPKSVGYRQKDSRVRGTVDSFVLLCVVLTAGYFQGLCPHFLVVFPVLWLLAAPEACSLETAHEVLSAHLPCTVKGLQGQ